MSFLKELIEKISLKVYNRRRESYIKETFKHFGEVEEKEDRFICYIDDSKIKKYNYGKFALRGFVTYDDETRKNIQKLKLNKPVHYIIENINFDRMLELYSNNNTKVIFKNCIFNKGMQVWADNLVFENNKYIYDGIDNLYSNYFFHSNHIGELTFKDENFINLYKGKKGECNNFNIDVCTDKINIINSKISTENIKALKINSKRTNITNSIIEVNELNLTSDSINCSDSSITASEGVIIENENNDFECEISSPIIFYNDKDLSINAQLDEEKEKHRLRTELIEKLRNLSKACEIISSAIVEHNNNSLDDITVEKILTKK